MAFSRKWASTGNGRAGVITNPGYANAQKGATKDNFQKQIIAMMVENMALKVFLKMFMGPFMKMRGAGGKSKSAIGF